MRTALVVLVFIGLVTFSNNDFIDEEFTLQEEPVIKTNDLENYIVIPVLIMLEQALVNSYTDNAVSQILGTVAVESNGGYHLVQVGADSSVGAKGIAQIESITHISIWNHFLRYNPKAAKIVRGMAAQHLFDDIFDGEELSEDFRRGFVVLENSADLDKELISNLRYTIAICRLVYRIADGPIPDSVAGQADYWKKNYNQGGKGTREKFITKYYEYVKR